MRYLSKEKPIQREEFGPLPPEVLADRRKLADEEARRDLSKPYEQLVADSHEETMDSGRSSSENLAYANRRLVSLYARVAIAAEESAKESQNVAKQNLAL